MDEFQVFLEVLILNAIELRSEVKESKVHLKAKEKVGMKIKNSHKMWKYKHAHKILKFKQALKRYELLT